MPRLLCTFIYRNEVRSDGLRIHIRAGELEGSLTDRKDGANTPFSADGAEHCIELPISLKRRGVELKMVIEGASTMPGSPDPKLVAVVAQAQDWLGKLSKGEVASVSDLAARLGVDRTDISRILPLAFLAPDIVQAIVEGRQPVDLTASRLKRLSDLPASWAEQRKLLASRHHP